MKNLVVSTLLLACLGFAQNAAAPEQHGIIPANMDSSVKPGDDFFEYCNGSWLKKTDIPPDRGGVSAFAVLTDLSNKRTADLIEEMAKSKGNKVADLYHAYMDEAGIQSRGTAPLKEKLDAIRGIGDKRALAHALGETLRADVDALNNTNFHTPNLFGMWVAPDFNDSDHYAPYLLQGGLQLPDRDYYLSNSEHMKMVREKYLAHVAATLKLAGFDNPEQRAQKLVQLEHDIAETHLTLAENDDIHKANNPWTQADFAAKAPGLEWAEYFRGAGLEATKKFIVWQPTAFAGEAKLVDSAALDTWKDWLAYHLIEQYAGVLPKAFADEQFAFFGQTLGGTPQQRPRWQRAVGVVNTYLGDEVGKVYAQRYFPPEAKAQAQAMVANIIANFRKRIDALDWMNPKTKAEAQHKLTTLYVGVGYAESWKDYSAYEVNPDDIVGDLWRGRMFEYKRQVARVGTPVDKHEWSMTPQTVNAVNLPLQNAMSFPAAILQPPFFDAKAPAAYNYGGIGSVIGHEISHTFDTEGAAFDAKGRVRNWWTDADLKHFEASTAQLAAQYDQYKPFPDLALNGKQTLAENIADVAGLAAALDGYHASLKGKAAPKQDGFTGDQQFFIAYGQSRESKSRDAAMRAQVATDSHSPSRYRTFAVRNIDGWYSAFDVKPGEKLYLAPGERVRIW